MNGTEIIPGHKVRRPLPPNTPDQADQQYRLSMRGHEPLDKNWMSVVHSLMDTLKKMAPNDEDLDIFKISSESGVKRKEIKIHGQGTGKYELRDGYYRALWSTAAKKLGYRESNITGLYKLPQTEILKRKIKKLEDENTRLRDELDAKK